MIIHQLVLSFLSTGHRKNKKNKKQNKTNTPFPSLFSLHLPSFIWAETRAFPSLPLPSSQIVCCLLVGYPSNATCCFAIVVADWVRFLVIADSSPRGACLRGPSFICHHHHQKKTRNPACVLFFVHMELSTNQNQGTFPFHFLHLSSLSFSLCKISLFFWSWSKVSYSLFSFFLFCSFVRIFF